MLEKQGKTAEANNIQQRAFTIADETALNGYGYQLMGQNKTAEAIEVFRKNVKKFPDSWNVYDSLAEALESTGDHKGAITNYKAAMAKAPEAQKKRIQGILKKLEK